jgi:hypothetical protein
MSGTGRSGSLETSTIRKAGYRGIAGFCLAAFFIFTAPAPACTIFVLTDTNRTLFCNNEDWSDPKTRIWFIPSSGKHYGGVYVGFDNNYAQGGLNTEGLAFDWVSGYNETWKPDPDIPIVWRNSGQQALEECATVEAAIAFFRKHQDRGFYRAKILLADRTGASVIIGGKDGKLEVKQATQCRGFGYGEQTLKKLLNKTTPATVSNGASILRAAMQKGQYATKYSNIFDLNSGDIFLFPYPGGEEVRLNLGVELRKGGHYYDMPQIEEQLAQAPRKLLPGMERFLIERYKAIPDREPQVTAHARAMVRDAFEGKARAEDYTPELWKEVAASQAETQAALKFFGRLVNLTLVERSETAGKRSYRYLFEFERNTLLQHLVFDEQNKLAVGTTEEIR